MRPLIYWRTTTFGLLWPPSCAFRVDEWLSQVSWDYSMGGLIRAIDVITPLPRNNTFGRVEK